MAANNHFTPLSPKLMSIVETITSLNTTVELMSNSLLSELSADTLTSVDAALNDTMRDKIYALKEEFVKEVHHNKITSGTFVQNGKLRYGVYTRHPYNGSKVRSSVAWEGKALPANYKVSGTYDILYKDVIIKLYSIYTGDTGPKDFKLKTVLAEAHDEWILMTHPKPETVRGAHSDYKRFISNELMETDIRTITRQSLMKYISNYIIENELTIKAEKRLITVLYRVFDYSVEHHYITSNPVPNSKNERRGLQKVCKQTFIKPENEMFNHQEITLIRDDCCRVFKQGNYNVKIIASAKLFSTYTACRVGEIPAIKWCDVKMPVGEKKGIILIHSEQIIEKAKGSTANYHIEDSTKNEKGICRGGREWEVPVPLAALLEEIKELQISEGIDSDYVFCDINGNPIKKKSIEDSLYKQCTRLKLRLTNNHSIRKYINSYILIPKGIPVTNRAQMLGHSVSTNERNYSFAIRDLSEVDAAIAAFDGIENNEGTVPPDDVTRCNPGIISFPNKRKSRKML